MPICIECPACRAAFRFRDIASAVDRMPAGAPLGPAGVSVPGDRDELA